jgi:precorrin-8X/cobalt-precorrin-8 methylmutase
MFDRFVVVDWSAQSTPKLGSDSIWIGVRDGAGEVSVTNLATRSAAETFLVDLFESDPTSSTLVGVDFSLGYPAGTAAALGLTGTAWSAMWVLLADQIRDDDRNGNNRFAVAAALNERLSGGAAPFWGCPPSAVCASLAPTKPLGAGLLAQFRATEEQLRAEGRRPFSSWQLLGAGAVGSQSMLGIQRLHGLRTRFADRMDVWPFTTGFGRPPVGDGAIVVAEVWPSMLAIDDAHKMVRDAAQVRATVRWLTAIDESGGLDALFSPALAPAVSAAAVAEEGWVLGVVT